MGRRLVSLLAAALLVGCSSGKGAGLVGNWKKANGKILVLNGDHTWNLVDVTDNEGTWAVDGATLTLTCVKVNGMTRTQFTDSIRKAKGDMAQGIADADRMYAPVHLAVNPNGLILTNPQGASGNYTKQSS
jgi:hypothetical protein